MNPEDIIENRTKLKEGIFFTKPEMVEKILSQIDLNEIKSVIDTAAGSCNFLIPLAEKFPEKQFYGIEKNEFIFRQTKVKTDGLKNLTYLKGDMIFDHFDIPECDLYIGNPPFVNLNDMDDDYRLKVIDIWKNEFPTEKGYKLLLGNSRGDLSQLIFHLTMKIYLKEKADCAVILPDSLLFGNEASRAFREFRNFNVRSLWDISDKSAFSYTKRPCFVLFGQKGEETVFPVLYRKQKEKIQLHLHKGQLVPQSAIIHGSNHYQTRQGINTLGANGIYMKNELPLWKSELLQPLYRSCDVKRWQAEPSRWILMPYREKKLLTEEYLMKKEPAVWKYLTKYKKELSDRKSPHLKKKGWYSLFGVGDYTFSPWKVIWNALGARDINAAVISKGIPNQAMHAYISLNDEKEAHYVCALMNSSPVRKLVAQYSRPGAKSFAQPGTVSKIPLPPFNQNEPRHKTLVKLSQCLHENQTPDEKSLEQIDRLSEELIF